MKRFKARKKRVFFNILIYLLCIYLGYQFCFNFLFDLKLESSNEEFILRLLNNSNYYKLYEKRGSNTLDKVLKTFKNIEPLKLLDMKTEYVGSDSKKEDNTKYFSDPKPVSVDNPKVYIYNTHQLEGYDGSNYVEYNITPNVLMASYLLKDKLNNKGIDTIVEEASIADFLNLNNLSYMASYQASRFFLEDILKKYDLDLIIDLHRDSISHEKSTLISNDKAYAKVLFVVGTDYESYEENLELSSKLNDIVNSILPGLSRGVLKKSGPNSNGVYNQDLSNKIILIECGGEENKIDEVMNTIDILSSAIYKYLEG